MEGLNQLHSRLGEQQLQPGDWAILAALVLKQIERAESRQERQLAKMAATDAGEPVPGVEDSVRDEESKSNQDPANPANVTQSDVLQSGDDDGTGQSDPKKPKGHGRKGAGAFRAATHFFYTLAVGVLGSICEVCGLGKLHRYREKVIIRIIGQPLFAPEAHHYEQARCRNCGHVERAKGPSHVHEGLGSDYIRYDWSACAMLIVIHYFAGGPFKRLESLHEGWGIPLSDSNQWDVVNESDDKLFPLCKALEQHAIAHVTNFRIDDTGSMVVALQRQINDELSALQRLGESVKNVRTGINVTGFYGETPNGPIILFYTGRHHAGEIVDQLLKRRLLTAPKVVKCTDGASKNFDHGQKDKVFEATCNTHAFLKFGAIRDKFPVEYAEAGSIYHEVYENDDKAKALGMTPLERMLYHREHSKPLMEKLKAMCETKVKSKLVEPNSPLWEPLTFVINQWERLTLFYKVPDVPLDTNLIEQALIIAIRYLAVSFNYHTEEGAVVGDHAMSLIASARANGVEPVAYLTECLRNHVDLALRPEYYLPWVYRERMQKEASLAELVRAPPGLGPPPALDAPARELRDFAPEVREGAARRVASPEQNLELSSE